MEDFRKQLINVINNSGLPMEAVYYIVKDVFRDVDDAYSQYLANKEKAEAEQTTAKEE